MPIRELGGVFSLPCFRRGLPGDIADLCIMDSSGAPIELEKYESSAVNRLFLPGDNGVPEPCWRPSLFGLPKVVGVSFIELSKAAGRSLAPGGFRFLLGLPVGVWTGVMKLFLLGVLGRSEKGSF